MANLIRSAKSGSDWSVNELLAYHITVKSLPPDEFFHFGADASLDHLDPAILTYPPGARNEELSDFITNYLGYLGLATRRVTQESFIDGFVRETLQLLGFDLERNVLLPTRYIIPLTICGEIKSTEIDICLLYQPTLILLVLVQDKTFRPGDAQSQVIAEAIAAFQFNNTKRQKMGLVPLESMTIPCITMSGTRPTFYLVPVTQALSTAVVTGQYPAAETEVLECITVSGHSHEGMENMNYRRLAFQHFLAFKTLAKSHWQKFLQDV